MRRLTCTVNYGDDLPLAQGFSSGEWVVGQSIARRVHAPLWDERKGNDA